MSKHEPADDVVVGVAESYVLERCAPFTDASCPESIEAVVRLCKTVRALHARIEQQQRIMDRMLERLGGKFQWTEPMQSLAPRDRPVITEEMQRNMPCPFPDGSDMWFRKATHESEGASDEHKMHSLFCPTSGWHRLAL